MIDVEKEIENLCKGEEQQIGKVLYEYGWKYKETMEQLGIGWRKVSKVRKPLIGVNYTVNDRKVIKGMELDFYIENKSIAIEVSLIRAGGPLL